MGIELFIEEKLNLFDWKVYIWLLFYNIILLILSACMNQQMQFVQERNYSSKSISTGAKLCCKMKRPVEFSLFGRVPFYQPFLEYSHKII